MAAAAVCKYLGLRSCEIVRVDTEWESGRVSVYESGGYDILEFDSSGVVMGVKRNIPHKYISVTPPPSFVYAKRVAPSEWYVFSVRIPWGAYLRGEHTAKRNRKYAVPENVYPSTVSEQIIGEDGLVIHTFQESSGPEHEVPSSHVSNPFARAFYSYYISLPWRHSDDYVHALARIAITHDNWYGGKRRAFSSAVKKRWAFDYPEIVLLMILHSVVEFEPRVL